MTDEALVGPVTAPDLHVMSFNIRRRMPRAGRSSPDRWSHRAPALARQLAVEQPAILGVQEALIDQADFVGRALGRRYQWIGRGRDADGTGEMCPIFFDTARLHLDEWTQLALSTTPGIPGSRTWGNRIPRVVVRARLTDIATGSKLTVLNTHLDHLSRRSRLQSADMLADLAHDGTVILTGDFNTSVETGPYQRLVPPLTDAWERAQSRLTPEWGTYPNYREPKLDRKRIDWILVSGDVEVPSAGIDTALFDGVAPSDHLPVHAVLRLGAPAVSSDPAAHAGSPSVPH